MKKLARTVIWFFQMLRKESVWSSISSRCRRVLTTTNVTGGELSASDCGATPALPSGAAVVPEVPEVSTSWTSFTSTVTEVICTSPGAAVASGTPPAASVGAAPTSGASVAPAPAPAAAVGSAASGAEKTIQGQCFYSNAHSGFSWGLCLFGLLPLLASAGGVAAGASVASSWHITASAQKGDTEADRKFNTPKTYCYSHSFTMDAVS